MDLTDRIRRRQRTGDESRIVIDYGPLSPVAHFEEPTGRGPVLERLLDYLDPVFGDGLPPNAYVWGPAGAGKSAAITALFAHLSRVHAGNGAVIHTTTRSQSGAAPSFVYVDGRRADSDFGLYHAILDALLDESVPRQGVGTETLRSQLAKELRDADRRTVVAIDHVGEPGTAALADLTDALAVAGESLRWVAVGRPPPSELPEAARPPERIEIPAYERHALVDVLTARASEALARRAVEHEQIRRLAGCAEGDAHDALAALFGAADRADAAGHDRIHECDLEAGVDAVPRPSAPLGRVLTLSANRQLVLRAFVDLDEADAASVGAATEAIAADPSVDLSAATIERFLYELAETGIVQRTTSRRDGAGTGRPPSRIEPLFPTIPFRRLYDRQRE